MIAFPQVSMNLNEGSVPRKGLRVAQNFHVPKTDTRIHEALTNGCKYCDLEDLLARGARASDQNNEGDTAVHVAFLINASSRVLDFMLTSYLNETSRNLKNKSGLSVLHIACSRPHLDIVEKLAEYSEGDVECQIDIEADTKIAGYTPMHMAVEYNRYEITEYLAENFSVDFCLQNRFGSTPLHIALDRRSVPIIDLILEHIDEYEDVVDDSGLTHFMAACAGSSTIPVTKYLRQQKNWECKKALVDAQVNNEIPEYNYAGYTPVHFAAEFGRYEIMEILLLYCTCSDTCFAENCKKFTPLVAAIRHGHLETARLLFKFYKMCSKALFISMKMGDQDDSREQTNEN